VAAGEDGFKRVPAVVLYPDGGLAHGPPVAPLPQPCHQREQLAACFGQVVLEARGVLAVLMPLDQSGAFELAEAVSEYVAGDAGVGSDPGELVDVIANLPDDQQRPALPDDV
jgi:hypothetical protein